MRAPNRLSWLADLAASTRDWTLSAMSLEVNVRGTIIPAEELNWRFSRSPGPGGQSVNTADTRVELGYDLAASAALPPLLKERAMRALAGRLTDGVITVVASEYRSQLRNRESAAARLSELLTKATAPPAPPRRPTKPTRASVERRLAAKQRRAKTKRLRRSTDE
jgi:ribosome-associated protein